MKLSRMYTVGVIWMACCVCTMTKMAHGFSVSSNLKLQKQRAVGVPFVVDQKIRPSSSSALYMSDGGGGGGSTEKARGKKRGLSTITKDKTELKSEEDKKPEEMWRVILHNDEINTFQYAVIAICKTIGTIDRKKAFDMCVVTHAEGKCTLTKSYKEQAMKYCLGLQRNGLTASIAPDSKFEGGGEPEAGGEE